MSTATAVEIIGTTALADALRDALVDVAGTADVHVFGYDDRAAQQATDDQAWHRGTDWVPVLPVAGALLVGPVISPGRTPCLRCIRTRQGLDDRADLHRLTAAAESLAAGGVAAHHVALTAAVLRGVLERSTDPRGAWVDLSGVAVTPFPALGIHGCPRCSRHLYVRDAARFTSLVRGPGHRDRTVAR